MPRFLDQKFPETFHRPVLFIDFEFTGLDVGRHEIIEVAALLTHPLDYSIANSYYTKVIPTHIDTADPQALEVVGYDSRKWQNAIPLRQMLLELSQLAPACILAGWIVQNEWNFLLAALQKENLPFFFDEKLIEVWTLAYVHFQHDPLMKHLNLANTCKALNIPITRHQPDSDIRATYAIFKRLIGHPKTTPQAG